MLRLTVFWADDCPLVFTANENKIPHFDYLMQFIEIYHFPNTTCVVVLKVRGVKISRYGSILYVVS